jgi:AdoMet-dependent heme synthase
MIYYDRLEADEKFLDFVSTVEVPNEITWNITYRCNLNCRFCGVASFTRTPRYFPKDEVSKKVIFETIDLIKDWGVRRLYFTGGEPFLRKDMLEILAAAKRAGLIVGMVCNGTLITRSLADKIIKMGIDNIMISIDGSTSGIHDNLRNFTGAYDLTVTGIRNLLESRERNSGETFICTNTVIMRYNLNDLPALSEMLSGMGVDALNLQVFLPNSEDDEYLKVTQTRLVRKNLEGFILKGEHRTQHVAALLERIAHLLINGERLIKKCISPAVSLFITQNGDVYPCCFISERDEFVMGNIKRENLRDIWNKKDYSKMRRNFLQGIDHEVCKMCTTLSEPSSKLYLEEIMRDRGFE